MWCLTAALLMTQVGHRQSAQAAATKSCAKGGVCKLGDRGPGGGIVFHVAPTVSWWGEYIEAFARPVGGSPRTWGDSIVHKGMMPKRSGFWVSRLALVNSTRGDFVLLMRAGLPLQLHGRSH